ncbi:MAG: four helix bundle protein [Elusimicrobiota bacterium]
MLGLKERTYKFSLMIIKLVQNLPLNQVSKILGGQITRSATSVGANTEEAYSGLTKKDFSHSINIARKEANETRYWLRLLLNSGLIQKNEVDNLFKETDELISIFTSIVKKTRSSVILILAFNFLFFSCLYAQDILTLYQNAMESFYKKDYKKAIAVWEEILKIDPKQKNPPKLIEMARSKMLENVKPLLNEFQFQVEKGSYTYALEKVKQLLEIDPSNPTYQKHAEKLGKLVSTLTPALTDAGKINELIRKSITAYILGSKDERLPVLSSRYAWQLAPNAKLTEKTLIFMEKEYTTIARLEVMEGRKNVIEQKLATILEDIYDGKYEHAILECEIVIAIEPDNILVWKRLGSAYYALGKRVDAKLAWEKALKLDPSDKDIAKFYQKVK